VAGEGGGVEACPFGIGLDDIGDGPISQPLRCNRAGLIDGPEDRAGLDTGRIQPFLQRAGGADYVAPRNGNGDTFAFLVRLAAPDRHQKTGLSLRDVGHVEDDQL
jgi:hypothetical protein